MSKSKRLKDLERSVELLREQFLPTPFDPLGVYDNASRVQAYTRAFLVLSHAEFEGYLEQWAKDLTRKAEEVWKEKGRITAPLGFLIATSESRLRVPDKLSNPTHDGPANLRDMIKGVLQAYYKTIKDSHGVKEKNFSTLFAPLGLPASAITATLLPNLNSFGENRGDHAHNPARVVSSVLDPETEYQSVKTILVDLAHLDGWLMMYSGSVK